MLDVNILKKYGLDTGLEHDFSMKHGSLMLFGHPVETNLNDLLPAHSNGRTCGGGWPQLWQQALLASVASPIWDSMFCKTIFPMLIAIKIGAHPSFRHQPKNHLVDSTSINHNKSIIYPTISLQNHHFSHIFCSPRCPTSSQPSASAAPLVPRPAATATTPAAPGPRPAARRPSAANSAATTTRPAGRGPQRRARGLGD